MAEIRIELDPVSLREATTQAIVGTLTPEVRERILRESISALLTPSTNSWERGKSPLQQAFDSAVSQIARECAKDLLEKDETIKPKIQALLRDVADAVISADREKLVSRMSDAFISSLRRD